VMKRRELGGSISATAQVGGSVGHREQELARRSA